MSASTDILYHAHSKGYDIDEFPTTIDYSVDGASSQAPLEHGITLVMNIVRTIERDRPITMLGVPGVACSLVGFAMGYWTVANFVSSGSLSLGLALTASVFVIVGILASFTAIILHSLALFRD